MAKVKTLSVKVPALKTEMTPFPYSIEAGETVSSALILMREHAIRHLPVREAGLLVGIISERDVLRALSHQEDQQEVIIRDCFLNQCYSVEIDTPLAEVLRELVARQIGACLVTRNGNLAGIFTTMDACRAFADLIDPRESDHENQYA